MIEARLDDGRVLRFPDGTSSDVVQNTVKKMLSEGQQEESPGFLEGAQQGFNDFTRGAVGALGAVQTVGTGALVEPVAGLAGIAREGIVRAPQALRSIPVVGGAIANAGQAELDKRLPKSGDVVRGIQDAAADVSAATRTQQADNILVGIGNAIAPVSEGLTKIEDFLGDTVFEATGSPAAAAAAKTVPTAFLEVLGVAKPAKGLTKLDAPPKSIAQLEAVKRADIDKAIVELAPEVDQIKNASREIFKELDESNVTVQTGALKKINNDIDAVIKAETKASEDAINTARKIQQDLSPQRQFSLTGGSSVASEVTPGKLIDARRDAQDIISKAQRQGDGASARLGIELVDEIDAFMTSLPDAAFKGNVGQKLKVANALWGRAKRAELIDNIFNNADIRGAGDVVKNIKSGFSRIIQNPKVAKFFPDDELNAMREFVRNQNAETLTKTVGKFGINRSLLNTAAGQAVIEFMAPGSNFATRLGALAAGTVAKARGARSAQNAAELLRRTQLAGPDSRKIVDAYLQLTPKASRSADDLADLLLQGDTNIVQLLNTKNDLIRSAAEIAKARRNLAGQAAVGLAPAALSGDNQDGQ